MSYNTFLPIVTDGLVLYFDSVNSKSYNGGYIMYDMSSYVNNGVITNGAYFTYSNGGVIRFDGVDGFIEFGDVIDLSTNSMTVNTWIKLTTVGNQIIFSKSISAVQDYGFSGGIQGQLFYAFIQGNSGPGTDILPYSTTIPTTDEWFMITFVYDRSDRVRIYYNAVEEVLVGDSIISQWNGLDFQSNNPFRIGSYTSNDNITPSDFIGGDISMTQVYHRVLSNDEILQNYNAHKNRFI